MAYTPNNNPYIPGDPYSYDLKWLVSKIKAHDRAIETLPAQIQAAVIAALDQHDPIYYSTAADLIASDQKPASIAYIEGFNSIGDGGANLYYITDDYNDIIVANFYLTMAGANRWALPIILTPYVTPEMFGATSASSDNSAEFTIALKYNKPLLLAGNYTIATPVYIPSNITVYGGGLVNTDIAPVASGQNTGAFIIDSAAHVVIKGITFKGTGAVSAIINKTEILIKGSEDIRVSDCRFYDIESGTVIKTKESDKVDISNNHIERYTFSGISFVHDNKNITVNNNYLSGLTTTANNSYPITLSAYEANDDPDNVTVNAVCMGNIIVETTPRWEAIDAHGGENIIVSNNNIKGTMAGVALVKTSTGTHPINCTVSNNIIELGTSGGAGQNCCIVSEAYNCTITGNVCLNGNMINQGSGAFYITGAKRTKITGNTIINAYDTAFELRELEDVFISDNIIIGLTPTAGQSAIFSIDNSANFVNLIVTNNTASKWDISTYSTPLMIRGRASYNDGSYIKFIDNSFSDTDAWSNSNAATIIISPTNYAMSSVTMGKRGDMVVHKNLGTGDPMISICTTAWADDHTGGVWQNLGTVS